MILTSRWVKWGVISFTLFYISCDNLKWNLSEKPLIKLVEITSIYGKSCDINVELKLLNKNTESTLNLIEYQFYSDTNQSNVLSVIKSDAIIGMNNIHITGLSPNTLYYLKVIARNPIGESALGFYQLKTLNQSSALTVTTDGYNSLSTNGVTINGNLINSGSSQITNKGFCYSTSNNPTISNSIVSVSGISMGNYSAQISGLSSNTTYYYRAFAINSTELAYGTIKQFHTTQLLTIGQDYQGGIIGYIYQMGDIGYVAGEQHGVIIYPHSSWNDLFFDVFSSNTSIFSGASLGGLGNNGATNTTTIVQANAQAAAAAYLCNNLQYGGYSDWYLPSIGELTKIFLNSNLNGAFTTASNVHWSSTEVNASLAKAYDSYFLVSVNMSKLSNGYILPVRRF